MGLILVGRGTRTTSCSTSGQEELVIRTRYEALSIANDVLIGLWSLVGSFMFFSETLQFAGPSSS